jgi:DNA-directed RNA polymerase alpha subunit
MEYVNAFKTKDGQLFASKADAQNHEFGQLLSKRLDAFSVLPECPYPDGVANSQMRKSIVAWELNAIKESQADTIDSLQLTCRTTNCLKASNIFTIGELLAYNENMLIREPNFGRKSLLEIKEALAAKNMRLAG